METTGRKPDAAREAVLDNLWPEPAPWTVIAEGNAPSDFIFLDQDGCDLANNRDYPTKMVVVVLLDQIAALRAEVKALKEKP